MTSSDMKSAEERVQELRNELIDLEAEAKKKGVEAEAEWKKTRAELKGKLRQVRERLEDAKGKSGDAWDEMKAGITEALSDIQDAYRRAREQL
ncbi:MAG: hypothetical protein ACOC7S_00220 [Planctomycetota bacterium]